MNRKHVGIAFALVFLIVILSGCPQPIKPYFHPLYFPSSIPDQSARPALKIEISEDAAQRIVQHNANMRPGDLSWEAPNIYWLNNDNLYLTIGGLYGTFLIIPSSKQITKLEGAEEEAVRKQIAERMDIHVTRWGSAVRGDGVGMNVKGTLRDGRRKVSISGQWMNAKPNVVGDQGLIASLKDNTTGKTSSLKLLYKSYDRRLSPRQAEAAIRDYLRRFYISPDGRYYIWAPFPYRQVVLTDADTDSSMDIMLYYVFHSFAIDPDWKKIALLKGQGSENKPHFWIELYDFNLTAGK